MTLLLGALGILWRYKAAARPGETFWRFVALYSAIELFVEGFRANATTWVMGILMAQVVALAILLVALYLLSFYTRADEHTAGSG